MSTAAAAPASKGLNAGLWIVQALLGLAFIGAGVMKSTAPITELATKMTWVPVVGEAMTRFIGVSEFLGGVGLLLPALTRIQPKLTGVAGAALALVMVLARGLARVPRRVRCHRHQRGARRSGRLRRLGPAREGAHPGAVTNDA